MMEISSSSKRVKTPAAGGNNMSVSVSCLVDGCNADLGQCREYHRRHKVCEPHSKTPKVTIGGREQRFCQQCSRFHSLVEFDEGKRSCRKRLDGHNRRRRKPQSDSVSRTTTTFLSNQQGIARILSFNSTQIHLSAVVGSARTTAGFKPDNSIGPFNNQPHLDYLTRHHLSSPPSAQNGGDNRYSFLQHRSPPLAVSANQQLNRGGNARALSLLSSSPPATHQSSTGIMSPISSGVSQYGYAQEMHNETMLAESSGATRQFQGMFNDDDDHGDSSSSGIKQQTLSFRWD